MKKRLMTRMLVGGLMAAIVPGVASAAEPEVSGSLSCTSIDGNQEFTIYFTDQPISGIGARILRQPETQRFLLGDHRHVHPREWADGRYLVGGHRLRDTATARPARGGPLPMSQRPSLGAARRGGTLARLASSREPRPPLHRLAGPTGARPARRSWSRRRPTSPTTTPLSVSPKSRRERWSRRVPTTSRTSEPPPCALTTKVHPARGGPLLMSQSPGRCWSAYWSVPEPAASSVAGGGHVDGAGRRADNCERTREALTRGPYPGRLDRAEPLADPARA